MTITEFKIYAPAEILNALVGVEGELNVEQDYLNTILQEAENYVNELYSLLPSTQKKKLTALEALSQLFMRQGQYDYVMKIAMLKDAELNAAKTYVSSNTKAVSDPQIFTTEEREMW